MVWPLELDWDDSDDWGELEAGWVQLSRRGDRARQGRAAPRSDGRSDLRGCWWTCGRLGGP